MAPRTPHMKYITAILLISFRIITSSPAKNNARPVVEIINEQSRVDDKMRPPGILPYGNPLAGNSKQNARLHAQNQQAMFNAERIRQHRAQLQRWSKAPQQEDSYMKAYHESQETHQLALEQHLKDNKQMSVTKAPSRVRVVHNPRHEKRYARDDARQDKRIKPSLDIIKITKDDAVLKDKNRNHRSYGSNDYKQYIQPKKFQTVVSLAPGPTYDQGVTIKPNGNNGLTTLLKSTASPEDLKLYTAAVPSETQYIYPKQYGQMQNYQSAYEFDTLNSLLNKPAAEQLDEFNALINSEKHTLKDQAKDTLTTPIDLYFYLKDSNSIPNFYEQSTYGQIAPTYASAYPNPIKDHTPITEEIDDTEDPNKNNRLKHYGIQPVLATQADESIETTTTKSNNYYKVEVASQTISAPYKPNEIRYYYKQEDKPSYETLQYAKPTYYGHDTDSSERYLHHNAQHIGVHHLTEDGVGVSAYGDDNVSISNPKYNIKTDNKTRKARSTEKLDTNPFAVSPLTKSPIVSSLNDTPKAEPLFRVNYFNNQQENRQNELSTFLATPIFPVGVASDFDINDYEQTKYSPSIFNNNDKFEMYEDDEEFDEDGDEYDNDYEERPQHSFNQNRFENYAPSAYNQNDVQGSFSNHFKQYQRPKFSFQHFGKYPVYSPHDSYGVPIQDTYYPEPSYDKPVPVYGPPHGPHGVPLKYGYPNTSPELKEPVFVLTQSQLKNLVGSSNLNIQHYDIYQLPKSKPKRRRKHKKRYSRPKHFKKNIGKLRKLRLI